MPPETLRFRPTSKVMTLAKWSPSALALAGAAVVVLLVSPAMSRCAHAFGGVWSSQAAPVKQTAERIVFVDNPDSTVTAIVQLDYAGPSPRFAWVIPVPGKPTVGISSNTLFERLDAATAPEYWVEVTDGPCTHAPDAAVPAAPSRPDDAAAPAMKVDRGSVGPYDYVDLVVDPQRGDPTEFATHWLTSNGYEVTGIESAALGWYLSRGYHLLAFRLTSGLDAAAGAIRPVVLTYESKQPTIPLRPTAVSAREGMGVQVWVFGPSQAVPVNYRSLVLDEARIDWLSAGRFAAGTLPKGGVGPVGAHVSRPSNYDAVVAAADREASGQGFVTELGGPASQYRALVWSSLDAKELPTIASQHYADGIDAIIAANGLFGGWDGWQDAIRAATALPADVTIDAFARDPGRYRGLAKVDTVRFFERLREGVVKPVADAAAMFDRAPYLTRLYGVMRPDAMTIDPVFDYDVDLAQISNVHVARQRIDCGRTPDRQDASWRLRVPQGGVIAGQGNLWPVSAEAMPANLKIVDLSGGGAGTVVKDNSDAIGRPLSMAGAPGRDIDMPHPPQNGALIGSTQIVPVQEEAAPTYASRPPAVGTGCSIASAGAGAGFATLAPWLPLACAIVTRRRRPRGAVAESAARS
jgi:hypothetical protein